MEYKLTLKNRKFYYFKRETKKYKWLRITKELYYSKFN